MNQVRRDEGEEPVEGGDTAPLLSDVFQGTPDPTLGPDPRAPAIGSDQTGKMAEGGGRPKEGIKT